MRNRRTSNLLAGFAIAAALTLLSTRAIKTTLAFIALVELLITFRICPVVGAFTLCAAASGIVCFCDAD